MILEAPVHAELRVACRVSIFRLLKKYRVPYILRSYKITQTFVHSRPTCELDKSSRARWLLLAEYCVIVMNSLAARTVFIASRSFYHWVSVSRSYFVSQDTHTHTHTHTYGLQSKDCINMMHDIGARREVLTELKFPSAVIITQQWPSLKPLVIKIIVHF
jgi:hypothetical protein